MIIWFRERRNVAQTYAPLTDNSVVALDLPIPELSRDLDDWVPISTQFYSSARCLVYVAQHWYARCIHTNAPSFHISQRWTDAACSLTLDSLPKCFVINIYMHIKLFVFLFICLFVRLTFRNVSRVRWRSLSLLSLPLYVYILLTFSLFLSLSPSLSIYFCLAMQVCMCVERGHQKGAMGGWTFKNCVRCSCNCIGMCIESDV